MTSKHVSDILARLRLDDSGFAATLQKAGAELKAFNTLGLASGTAAVAKTAFGVSSIVQPKAQAAAGNESVSPMQGMTDVAEAKIVGFSDKFIEVVKNARSQYEKSMNLPPPAIDDSRLLAMGDSYALVAQDCNALTVAVNESEDAIDAQTEVIATTSAAYEEASKSIKNASDKLKAFGDGAKTAGRDMMIFGGMMSAPFVLAIREASKLEETVNKFDVVFGTNSAVIKKWADDYGKAVGRSSQQMYQFIGDMQDFLVPMGFAPEEATGLSKTLTALAIDMASFNNSTDEAALIDLRAAMSGSGEVMKKYGVILSEATTAQKAMQMGMDPKVLTEQQKAQARLQVILEGTQAAQGDAARSAGSFANQLKRLQGEAVNAGAAIGASLLPAATYLLKVGSGLLTSLGEFAKENPVLIQTLAGLAVGTLALGAGIFALGTIAEKTSAIIAAWPAIVNVATVAAGGLSTALKALFLTPAGLAILAVAGALYALKEACDSADSALNESAAAAAKTAKEYTKLREEGDVQRQSSLQQFERLKELASMEDKTTSSRIESRQIISDLTKRYGDLGLVMDQTTGAIKGMDVAQVKLNKTMGDNYILELEKEKTANQRNMELIDSKIKSMKRNPFAVGAMLAGSTEYKDLNEQKREAYVKNQELYAKINNAKFDKAQGNATVTLSSKNPALLSYEKQVEINAESLTQEEDITKNSLKGYQKELAELEKIHGAHLKNLEALKENAKARREMAIDTLAKGNLWDNAESFKTAKGDLEKYTADLADYEKDIATAQAARVSALGASLAEVNQEIEESLMSAEEQDATAITKTFDGRLKKLTAVRDALVKLNAAGDPAAGEQIAEVDNNIADLAQGRLEALGRSLKDVNREVADSLLNDYQRERGGIEKTFDDRLKKLTAVRAELADLAASGDDAAFNQMLTVDTQVTDLDQAKQKAIGDLNTKQGNIFNDYLEDFDKQEEDRERAYLQSRDDRELNKMEEADPAAALASVQLMMQVAKDSMTDAAKAYKEEIAKAAQDMNLSDDERRGIDEKKRVYDISSGEFEKLRDRMNSISDKMENATAKTQGTFNAETAQRMTGTVIDPQVETARSTKELVRLSKATNKLLKDTKSSASPSLAFI